MTKAVATESNLDHGFAKKPQREAHSVSVLSRAMQPAPIFDGRLIQRKAACACGGGCPRCASLPFNFQPQGGGEQHEGQPAVGPSATDAAANQSAAPTASAPASSCADAQVSTDKDPLPNVPAPTITMLSAPELLERVKQMQAPGAFIPKKPPLGATQPMFKPEDLKKPVSVKALPDINAACLKCVAEWELPVPTIVMLIATGFFSDEPSRFYAPRREDVSGCPESPLAHKKEVRKLILPEALLYTYSAELEHWLDFVLSYLYVGGRYLANVRRLTPDRTHLRGQTIDECAEKVGNFLMRTSSRTFVDVLGGFGGMFLHDVTTLYAPNTQKRDSSGQHKAYPRPTEDQPPIVPQLDTDKNPFGCDAYFRKFDRTSAPGLPGPPSTQIIEDKEDNIPPTQPWHVL